MRNAAVVLKEIKTKVQECIELMDFEPIFWTDAKQIASLEEEYFTALEVEASREEEAMYKAVK